MLTIVSSNQIDLSWTNGSTDEDGISIERSTNGIDYAEIYTTLAGVSTYSNTGLSSNTTYYYKVRAFKGIGYSNYSNVADSANLLPLWFADKFLFFGYYSEISENKMPNRYNSDWLTISGSVGSETYTCPDNDTYKIADEDYIWSTTVGVVNDVTTANLIGYDFARTLVWYSNTFPNNIVAIAILKSGETLTTVESDTVRDIFNLSLWWDGTLSEHGGLKDNRGIGQSVWVDWMELEAKNLVNRMIDLNEEPVKARKILINRNIKRLKDAGYWARMDRLCLYAAHGIESSKLNWIKDDFNSTYMAYSIWTQDRGIKTSGNVPNNDCVKTGYTPSIDGINYQLNSASFGIYYRTNLRTTSVGYEGGVSVDGVTKCIIARPTRTGIETYALAINGATKTATLAEDLNGLLIGTRTSSTVITLYFNGVVKLNSTASSSVALVDRELFEGGLNTGLGYPVNLDNDEKALSFIMDGVTQADVDGLVAILVDDYLASIGAKV